MFLLSCAREHIWQGPSAVNNDATPITSFALIKGQPANTSVADSGVSHKMGSSVIRGYDVPEFSRAYGAC